MMYINVPHKCIYYLNLKRFYFISINMVPKYSGKTERSNINEETMKSTIQEVLEHRFL